MDLRLEEYDYELAPERIAQAPAARRDESRLLVLDRSRPGLRLARFREIGDFLRPGDLLVLNDARVFPARLRGRRPSGGKVEVFLLASLADDPVRWQALVKPARAGRGGGPILIDRAPGSEARALREEESGRFVIEVHRRGSPLGREAVFALCEEAGEVPLPPYIERGEGDPLGALDRQRYQTVYARSPGAVAAPTAGLHFTETLLAELAERGIERVAVTLTVGLGTFQPVREETLRSGRLFREPFSISARAGERILEARRQGRRIVAVGTTSARALESWARAGTPLAGPPAGGGFAAETDLLIAPGHRFALVDALLTNFHLPRSTLLLLVAAFAGRERILDAYRIAMDEGFRFYSYGDAMLLL